MFKGHPKGLYALALANTGERFGYYTMLAVFALFLRENFGLEAGTAGAIYSTFLGLVYFMPLVGGMLADKFGFGRMVTIGISVMFAGYMLLSFPLGGDMIAMIAMMAALLLISLGTGLFKGNLQVMVGNLYDDPKYADKRDSGFQIFYMFINIGGCVAPFIATWVRDSFVKSQGFLYNSDLPGLCWQYKNGEMTQEVLNGRFTELATQVSNGVTPDMTAFADAYLNAFNTGFHYAFSVAIVAMLVSLVIFLAYKKVLPNPAAKEKVEKAVPSKEEIKQDAKEIKQRILALFAVFGIVIFFWFSFHQNGLTLTMFAKDYTLLEVFGMPISAEIFQSINPFVVVFLTPVVMWIFGALAKKGKEPSTPKKIGIGMGIAALAYVVMAVASLGLPLFSEIKATGLADSARVTPWVLFSVYFILTIAELFISPLGLSFVSKVAPAHLQGLMQGCWLGATAVGNFSLFLGAVMYESISLAATWSVFAVVCFISMAVMFCMVKWLERVAK